MQAGVYGKVPSQGDFISRRLPWEFTSGWDGWLQAGLSEAKRRLGESWLDSYLTAPIWRFQLAAGVLGGGGWVGLWFPSVDRVGRHFPLTLAVPLPTTSDGRYLVLEADAAFLRWEDVALQALDPRLAFEQFDSLLAELPPLYDERGLLSETEVVQASGPAVEATDGPAQMLYYEPHADAPTVLQQACLVDSVGSCFFSWGGEKMPPALCRTGGLLPLDSFHVFFEGPSIP